MQLAAARRGRAAPGATAPATYCMTRYGSGAGVLDGVDGDDVVVADGGRGPGLAGEPLAGGGAGRQLRGHHLDRHHPVQLLVERPEHDPHPAPADDLLHLVVAQPAERPGLVGRVEEVERFGGLVGRGRVSASRRRIPGRPILPPRDWMAGFARKSPAASWDREQRLDPLAQGRVTGAGLVQVGRALGRRGPASRASVKIVSRSSAGPRQRGLGVIGLTLQCENGAATTSR